MLCATANRSNNDETTVLGENQNNRIRRCEALTSV